MGPPQTDTTQLCRFQARIQLQWLPYDLIWIIWGLPDEIIELRSSYKFFFGFSLFGTDHAGWWRYLLTRELLIILKEVYKYKLKNQNEKNNWICSSVNWPLRVRTLLHKI